MGMEMPSFEAPNEENGQGTRAQFGGINFEGDMQAEPTTSPEQVQMADEILADSGLELSLEPMTENTVEATQSSEQVQEFNPAEGYDSNNSADAMVQQNNANDIWNGHEGLDTPSSERR